MALFHYFINPQFFQVPKFAVEMSFLFPDGTYTFVIVAKWKIETLNILMKSIWKTISLRKHESRLKKDFFRAQIL